MKRGRLDSEDDEDEYLRPAMREEEEQLDPFTTTAGFHNVMPEMGFAFSSSSSVVSSEEAENNNSEKLQNSTQHVKPSAKNALSNVSSTEKSTSERFRCSQVEEDLDLPSEWIGLLSDALLAVYYVPLTYFQANRPMDDKLLAQYLPFNASSTEISLLSGIRGANIEEAEPNLNGGSHVNCGYVNPYGISPGWRWDGVVRGRKKTT